MDLFLYPNVNYSRLSAPPVDGGLTVNEPEPKALRDRWLKQGMRRTIHLVLMSHGNGIPHVLVLRSLSHRNKWGLVKCEAEQGISDLDAINATLKRCLLKSETTDVCQWTVGTECIAQFWRPEFDEFIYPYLPAHVSRPKEQLKMFIVLLPPRCVVKVVPDSALEVVPLSEIEKGGIAGFGSLLGAVPALISRFPIKMLVPSA